MNATPVNGPRVQPAKPLFGDKFKLGTSEHWSHNPLKKRYSFQELRGQFARARLRGNPYDNLEAINYFIHLIALHKGSYVGLNMDGLAPTVGILKGFYDIYMNGSAMGAKIGKSARTGERLLERLRGAGFIELIKRADRRGKSKVSEEHGAMALYRLRIDVILGKAEPFSELYPEQKKPATISVTSKAETSNDTTGKEGCVSNDTNVSNDTTTPESKFLTTRIYSKAHLSISSHQDRTNLPCGQVSSIPPREAETDLPRRATSDYCFCKPFFYPLPDKDRATARCSPCDYPFSANVSLGPSVALDETAAAGPFRTINTADMVAEMEALTFADAQVNLPAKAPSKLPQGIVGNKPLNQSVGNPIQNGVTSSLKEKKVTIPPTPPPTPPSPFAPAVDAERQRFYEMPDYLDLAGPSEVGYLKLDAVQDLEKVMADDDWCVACVRHLGRDDMGIDDVRNGVASFIDYRLRRRDGDRFLNQYARTWKDMMYQLTTKWLENQRPKRGVCTLNVSTFRREIEAIAEYDQFRDWEGSKQYATRVAAAPDSTIDQLVARAQTLHEHMGRYYLKSSAAYGQDGLTTRDYAYLITRWGMSGHTNLVLQGLPLAMSKKKFYHQFTSMVSAMESAMVFTLKKS